MALADGPFEAVPAIEIEVQPFALVPRLDPPGRALRRTPSAPPLPLLARGTRRLQVHPAEAPRRQEIHGHLSTLTAHLDLDLAVHLRPGPGGGRLSLHRPEPRSLPTPDMDALCRMIRDFVASGRLTTDDLDVGGCRCVAFGPRPLTEAGVYVFGRRDQALTLDERWAIHRRLAASPLPA